MLLAVQVLFILWCAKIVWDVVKQKTFLFSSEGSKPLFGIGLVLAG